MASPIDYTRGHWLVQLNFAAREVTIKLVYYGPALSGKTTNLKSLHEMVTGDSRGRLMTLETKDDRTLFFDMLPLVFRAGPTPQAGAPAMSVRLKVFTVPGQVLHASTRRLVLQGADGVAFIADSQVAQTENNAASFVDLKANLKELGRSVKAMPLIIQFNKRDLPNTRKDAELEVLARRGKEPVFTASAVKGEGVLESFFGLLFLTWNQLEAEHELGKKLGVRSDIFLTNAARRLGFTGDVGQLLAASVGRPLGAAPIAGGAP
jgi:signal recognition particle receptor subunit beta